MPKLVRINPVNPGQGYLARRYKLGNSKYPTFLVEKGWYTVDDATAAYLATRKNNPSSELSRPVFQVVSQDEAIALEEAEKEAARRAEASSPVPLPAGVDEVDWADDMGGGVTETAPAKVLDEATADDLADLDLGDDESVVGTATGPVETPTRATATAVAEKKTKPRRKATKKKASRKRSG